MLRTPETPGDASAPDAAAPAMEVAFACRDGVMLRGHLWPAEGPEQGLAIINAATGVRADYYHRYARFLAENGFSALTYDYRGIGRSRGRSLRGTGFRWRDWGELDFDAAVRWAKAELPDRPVHVVGHSIGGFLPGFAPSATRVGRILTVGAQCGYWGDYAPAARRAMFWKWHVAMPLITALWGYFPGNRLGWLEDLPAGVALEWALRGRRMETSYPPAERAAVLRRFEAVAAPILAVAMSDDPFAPPPTVRRNLGYYTGSHRRLVVLQPQDVGEAAVGHFGLFHARYRDSFWQATLSWLRDGKSPWPEAERLRPGRD